jgi:hypothetical protein
MATNWFLIIAFGVLLLILSVFVILVMLRKMKTIRLTVRDMRNPGKSAEKYYAIYDKSIPTIRIYKNLFQPTSTFIMPPVDMKSYQFIDGAIYGYRGISGNQDEDTITLLSWPLVGQVNASQKSAHMSDAVCNTLKFMDVCRKYKVGSTVNFELDKETLEGIITDMGYDGLEIVAMTKQKRLVEIEDLDGRRKVEKEEEVPIKYLLSTVTDISNAHIKEIKKPENEKDIGYDRFFTTDWMMANFGIVPINDVNVILRTQKEYIAEFNSRVNDRVQSRKSWLERNWLVMTVAIAVISLAVGYAIESWATQQYISGVIGKAVSNGGGTLVNAANSLIQK